jgi:hypothetical protein
MIHIGRDLTKLRLPINKREKLLKENLNFFKLLISKIQ